MKPKTEFPNLSPSCLYIGCPTRGRTALTIDCKTLLAASANTVYLVYASIRYMFIVSYNSLVNESRNNVVLLNTFRDFREKENLQKQISFLC